MLAIFFRFFYGSSIIRLLLLCLAVFVFAYILKCWLRLDK